MATLSELITLVRERLTGGPSASVSDDLISHIIESVVASAYPDWYELKSALYDATAEDNSYDLPDDAKDIVRVMRIEADGTHYPLTGWNVADGVLILKSPFTGTLQVDYTAAPQVDSVPQAYIIPKAAAQTLWVMAQAEAEPNSKLILIQHARYLDGESENARRRYRMHWPTAFRRKW